MAEAASVAEAASLEEVVIAVATVVVDEALPPTRSRAAHHLWDMVHDLVNLDLVVHAMRLFER